jgi:multiple sugar transport system permease protein
MTRRTKSGEGLASRRRKRIRELLQGYLFISPWLIGFFALTLGPFLASLALSFTKWPLLQPPELVGLRNYSRMFTQDQRFTTGLYNTTYFTLFSVPARLILAFFVAMLLNQKVRGIPVFRTCFYLPSITAGVATAILWIWILNPYHGILNLALRQIGIQGPNWLGTRAWAKPALIIMSLWGIGGQMVIFLAGLQGIPESLYDAAEVDGAGWWRKTLHVTIPLMTPTILFNLVMAMIGSFQVFTQALIMTDGGPADATLFYMLHLYRNAFEYFRMGYASALAWVFFLIVFALTMLQMRLSNRWVYYEV